MLVAAIGCGASAPEPAPVPPTLAAAQRAYEAYDLATSRALYRGVLAEPRTSREERVAAHRALARYDWQFDGDLAAARAHLAEARRLAGAPGAPSAEEADHGREPGASAAQQGDHGSTPGARSAPEADHGSASGARSAEEADHGSASGAPSAQQGDQGSATSALWAQQAACELDAGRPEDARSSAEHALAAARAASERAEAGLVAGRALVAIGGAAELARAARLLREVLDRRPGHVEASAALLEAAIGLDDGPLALAAWRSYFWIADGADVPEVLRRPHAALTALAPGWRGRPLGPTDRRALALALSQSRMFGLAARIARSIAAADPELASIIAYQAFLERVAAVNRRFYPRVANGLRGYAAAYDAAIHAAARPLWRALHPGGAPAFEPDRLFELIRQRFGAEGYIGTTVGFHGMLMGHVIHDERRQVNQYGRAGEFRYTMIDRGVSTDFTSWYGTTNVGGWGDDAAMVQVRAAYTAGPFDLLAWVTEPPARSALLRDIERWYREDLVRCAADPYAEPASLAPMLRLAASDELYAGLARTGKAGQVLALAFVTESLRLNVEATVFAHEGRHALDQRHAAAQFAAMDDGERELRAKLSEVAFSTRPRLALTGSILGGRLDESTGHGRANRRFRRLLVDWMTAHRAEIAGLDERIPMILQVARLTDDQLRGLVRAADPWAAGASDARNEERGPALADPR